MTFRVHFSDGTKLDVQAASPAEAGAAAKRQHDGVISKIKQVKEQG